MQLHTSMKPTRHEPGRARNLREHGLDFVDAERVFAGLASTFEDDRLEYGERRFVARGLLAGVPVSIVPTETDWSRLFDPSDKAKSTAEHPEAGPRTDMRDFCCNYGLRAPRTSAASRTA